MMFFFTGGLSICQPFVHEPPLISLAFYKGNCFWNGSQDIPIGHNNSSPPPILFRFIFCLIIPFIFVPSFSFFFFQQGLIKKRTFPIKPEELSPFVASSFELEANPPFFHYENQAILGRSVEEPTFLAGVEEGTPGDDLMRF